MAFFICMHYALVICNHALRPHFFHFFPCVPSQSIFDHYFRSCGKVICTRPQRTAHRLSIELGPVLHPTTAPVHSTTSDQETNLDDDTGYPHDGRADNTAYRHDCRADKRRYPHDREIDIQMLKMSRNGYILS